MMPKGRLEAFSDGVIAIVITLLVLEIHVPALPVGAANGVAARLVLPLIPSTVAFTISFVICAVWWISHHNFIHDLDHVDRPLLWLNCLFLLWLAFLPLPTALLGQNYRQALISALYGINCALTGASFWLMRWYASGDGHLLRADIDPVEARNRVARSALSPALYTVGAAISFLSHIASALVLIAIPTYFAFAGLSGPVQFVHAKQKTAATSEESV